MMIDDDPTYSQPHRAPPRNFAGARAAARVLREPKSPFVPRKAAGKERDLSACSMDELTSMMERNAQLLDSPTITSSLPGGDVRIRTQQARITNRIKELSDVQSIREDLQKTHLEDGDSTEVKMEDVDPEPEASSPRTKRRITEMFQSQSPNALMNSMSLTESLALQRQAVARDREAAARRAEQMEVDSQRPKAVGGLLKGALRGAPEMSSFMFAVDDSDEEVEEEFGISGDLDEEEEAALNPYRAAYEAGYSRAEKEDGEGEG